MEKKVEANIKILIEDADLVRALFKALKPEVLIRLRGVNSTIKLQDHELFMKIQAPDCSSFRATLNSFLRLLAVTLMSIRSAETQANNI